jgi:hypothetical protein
MYILVNWNLRALFRLNELSLGPKAVHQTEIQIEKKEMMHCFSIAQKVTYNYFTGKLHLFNHDFASVYRSSLALMNRLTSTSYSHSRTVQALI